MAQDPVNRRQAAALLAAMAACAPPSGLAQSVFRQVEGSRLKAPEAPLYTPPVSITAVGDLYRRMTAPIRVNGQGPYPFVVDTGSNQTVIAQDLATQLGLPIGPPSPINGVAGIQMAPTTSARLDVGSRRRAGAAMSVLPRESIGGAGLLGLDGLEGQAVTLDFRGEALRIEAGRRLRVDPDAITVRARRRSGQLTLVDADLAGLHLTAFLDSGAQNTIGNMALRALAQARNPNNAWWRTPIVSATGQSIDAEIADLPRLRVGGLRVPNWPVAFADLHTFRMWNLIDKPAILLGVDVLSRFEYVCLDFARDEVRFRLPQTA